MTHYLAPQAVFSASLAALPRLADLAASWAPTSGVEPLLLAGAILGSQEQYHQSAPTGSAPEAATILVPQDDARDAFDAATCIGCGACVAACPNASAMLFTAAKITHLGLLPQGQPERYRRVTAMVEQMDLEGFGGCTVTGECTAACPKEIELETISRLNADLLKAGSKLTTPKPPRPKKAEPPVPEV